MLFLIFVLFILVAFPLGFIHGVRRRKAAIATYTAAYEAGVIDGLMSCESVDPPTREG